MAETQIVLSEQGARELKRIIRKVDTLKGDGVKNTPTNIVIRPARRKDRRGGEETDVIWVNIADHTGCGAGKYNGYVATAQTEPTDPAADLVAADLPGNTTTYCLIENVPEADGTTNALEDGSGPYPAMRGVALRPTLAKHVHRHASDDDGEVELIRQNLPVRHRNELPVVLSRWGRAGTKY